ALPDRAPGSEPSGGSHHLPGRHYADRPLARPVPAQGRPAGVGGPASGLAGRGGRAPQRRLMPVSEFHGQVAAIALRAAAPHGVALGGGNALIAYGVIDRFTQDVDVFSDEEGGVEAASDSVEAALREAGFGTERRDKAGGLGDIFYGLGEGMAE